MRSAGHDPAALLRADRRLRALARELVRDPGAAEDLAQETWLAALGSGEIRFLPGWLATVVRRLSRDQRRSAGRRERRERSVARPEALPGTADLLAREEARARVVAALLALEEPLRTTLVLRFLEELPPRAVAARMDVPVETVRSRTRRGLEVLREALDRSFGDRASWCTALLPLLRPSGVSQALTTVLAAMTLQKLLALAVALLLCVLGWMAWPRGEREVGSVLATADAPPLVSPPRAAAELVRAEEPDDDRTVLPSQAVAPTRESYGSLRMRVTWHDGTAASGIGVSLLQYERENPELGQRQGTTDESGVLVFAEVPAGEASIVLDRGVWGSKDVERGKEAELALTIPRGFDLTVLVEDEEGARIAGAEIWTSVTGTLHDGASLGRTGSDGGLRVRSVVDWIWIAACARGYKPSKTESAGGDEGDEVEIRFVLRRGAGQVAGTVVDALTGEPVPGAFVGLGSQRAFDSSGGWLNLGEWARLARTDERGSFHAEGLGPGACSVAVRAGAYALWRDQIEVREDRTESVDVALLPEAALAGHVLDQQGRPVAGLTVEVGQGRGWLRAADRTDSDGSFRVGALEAGVTLEATVQGKASLLAATKFVVAPGETYVWEARLGEMGVIRGRLLDDAEQPLGGWMVEISDFESRRGDSATTAADGSFLFEEVADHPHLLTARSGLYSSLRLEGVRPREGELVLHVPEDRIPSVYIAGTFLDEHGQPIPGAEAMPWGDDNQSSPVECDAASGGFEVGPLPPGSWRLNLVPPDRLPVYLGPRDLAPGETWDCGEVRLAPPGRVLVRLRLEGIALDQDPKLRIRQGGWWRDVLEGGFALERAASLPPGRYEIVVLGGVYDEVAVPFEIESGADTIVEVPIRRGHRALVRVRLEDRSVTRVVLRVAGTGKANALTHTLGRSKDGTFLTSLHLAPGTYRVEASAGDRTAVGELRVEPIEREGDALVLDL